MRDRFIPIELSELETPEGRDKLRDLRKSYDRLMAALGEIGTEVWRSRTFKPDSDESPEEELIEASHQFIFPPQPEAILTDTGPATNGVSNKGFRHEVRQATYDSSAVNGLVVVDFIGSAFNSLGISPRLEARDDHVPESELPDEVESVVNEIFPDPYLT